MVFHLVFSSIYLFAFVEAGCPGDVDICDWTPWQEWQSCNRNCGGGKQYRWRHLCCKTELAADIHACSRDCHTSYDIHEHRKCNAFCNNGGTINYTFSRFGDCECPPTHSGNCCDNRICAWDDNYCWPGICYGEYVSNCDCIHGFRKVATSNETKCQPTSPPSIRKCEVNAIGQNGEYKEAVKNGNSVEFRNKSGMYGNFQPTSFQFELLAVCKVHVDQYSYPKPAFISEFKFGVTDILISVTKHLLSGTSTTLSLHNRLQDSNSSQNANETVFDTGSLSVLDGSYKISNGQSLCLKFEVRGGGYLKSKNTVTNSVSSAIPYNKVSTTKEICYRYDNDPPIHCQASGSCNIEPLQLQHRISRSSEQIIKFAGWTDPIPSGGSKVHASSIENYKVIVNQVVTSKGQPSKVDKVLFTKLIQKKERKSIMIKNLTDDNPRLYSITLEVKDEADNVRKARRFILVDHTSFITTRADKPFRVTTASSETNYTWQTNHQHVCLEWKDHFINEFYVDNEVLNPVEPDGHFTGVYEQLSGELPVSGTPNVNGITEFKLSWKLKDGNFSGEISVPTFLHQTYCTNMSVHDGQTYTFNLRSIDIANNTIEEERTVYIDRSAPYISNISVTENINKTILIHHGTDLTTLQLYFDASDPHSGIRSITWAFNETDSGLELASGALEVSAKSCSKNTERCYCPDVGPCELFNYTFPLNKLEIYNKHKGDRNTSYYITITVTNNAMLSSTEHKEIIVSSYQPEPGVVQEGNVSFTVGVTTGCLVLVDTLALAALICMRKRRLAKQSHLTTTTSINEDKNSSHTTDVREKNIGLEPVCYDKPEYMSPSTKLSQQSQCQHKNHAYRQDKPQETENVKSCPGKPTIENQASNQVCKPTSSQLPGGKTED